MNPKSLSRPTAAGVDVRPWSWDVTIGGVVRSPLSPTGVVRPYFIGKMKDENEVQWLFKQYNTRYAVIDTRPEAHLATKIQENLKKQNVICWRAQYNTVPGTIKVQENTLERLLTLDKTLCLDDVQYAFTSGLGVQLPQNFREITSGEFIKEMTSCTRVPTRHSGRDCYEWVKGGPDHSFNAFGYLLLAIAKSNLQFGGEMTSVGAIRGAVASTSNRDVSRIETGAREGPKKKARLDFDAIEQADERSGAWLSFEECD